MRSLAGFFDRFGVITQNTHFGADGGDSCNRSCAFLLSQKYRYGHTQPFISHILPQFHHPKYKGLLRRHPDTSKWYGDWNRASRDQTVPYLILLGETRNHSLLAWYFFMHMLRGFRFTTNTRKNHVYKTWEDHIAKSTSDVAWNYKWKLPDFTGPEFFNLYIRALPKPLRILLYPVLLVGDLETLIGSLVKRYITKDDDDIINHALVLINAERNTPTFLSWLAKKVTPASFIQERLESFFNKDIEPPLDELLKPSVEKYL